MVKFYPKFKWNLTIFCSLHNIQSPKFKRVLLNETPEFPFWDLNICVDFDLRDSKKNGKYHNFKE